MKKSSSAGTQAEQLASQYLQRRGLKLVHRNYCCSLGEIDLIMRDGEALVFIEVRLRSNPEFGGATASIDGVKQRKLINTAQHYLSTLQNTPPCRLDAVLFHSASESSVEWIRNAFTV